MTRMPGPAAVGLVADDVTGANDSAVQFGARGWDALLALAPPEALGSTADDRLVATSTDARAAGEAAAALTADAVRLLVSAGVDRLFLKIDSTMRGSVAHQVQGALQAWGDSHQDAVVVLCPAYPAMGRTVHGRRVLVHGEALEDGASGRDAVTPVTTSELGLLVPGSRHVERPAGDDAGTRAGELTERLRATGSSVLTVDAASDGELAVLAQAINGLGPRAVAAGSAGLAAAMATAWATRDQSGHRQRDLGPQRGGGAVVVLVTSVHDAALEQVRRLTDHLGASVLDLSPVEPDIRDEAVARSWTEASLHAVADPGRPVDADGPGRVVLVGAPVPVGPAPGGAGRIPSSDVARRLARTAAAVLASDLPVHGVVVVGGDGARALADELGAVGIAVRDAVQEGMPAGILVGGSRPGLAIVTKAGGFGEPDAVIAAVVHLETGRG